LVDEWAEVVWEDGRAGPIEHSHTQLLLYCLLCDGVCIFFFFINSLALLNALPPLCLPLAPAQALLHKSVASRQAFIKAELLTVAERIVRWGGG
jgi:hypothetical protein